MRVEMKRGQGQVRVGVCVSGDEAVHIGPGLVLAEIWLASHEEVSEQALLFRCRLGWEAGVNIARGVHREVCCRVGNMYKKRFFDKGKEFPQLKLIELDEGAGGQESLGPDVEGVPRPRGGGVALDLAREGRKLAM